MPHIHELYDFTTSAFILHPSAQKLLFVKHKKLGVWIQPGGHIELDENPVTALYREILEETGLAKTDFELVEIAEHPHPKKGNHTVLPVPFYVNEHTNSGTHRHVDLTYLARAKTARVTETPDGADAIAWLSLKDLKKLLDEHLLYDEIYEIAEWVFAHLGK